MMIGLSQRWFGGLGLGGLVVNCEGGRGAGWGGVAGGLAVPPTVTGSNQLDSYLTECPLVMRN